MAKIYYSEEEAASRLQTTVENLATFVRDGKLRSFLDGSKKVFKVADVDALASSDSSGEIELAPADTSAGNISLSQADAPKKPGKEDTVITAEGISIFDDEDLEIEAADPMAKTQIAPSLEEQANVEGGSGSGLLDLTRESDDTSLGSEVLDHINMDTAAGGSGIDTAVGSGIGAELSSTGTGVASAYPAAEIAPAAAPTLLEAVDAVSGAFSGMIVGTAIVMLLLSAVAGSLLFFNEVGLVAALKGNLLVAIIGALVVMLAGAGVGFMVGRSAAARQAALQNV